MAGFDILAAVEIEAAYTETLRANASPGKTFNGTEIVCADIRDLDPARWRDAGIECIIGGPPCQTFSAAGRRSGGVLGTNDQRGRLFEAYCHFLAELEPKAFVFENVYGLPGANGGGPWREIIMAFSALGYTLSANVVDAADYGVPQHRERLIMVGHRSEFRFPLPTHGPDSPHKVPFTSVETAIIDLQDPAEPYHNSLGGRYGDLLALVPEGLNYSFFTAEMGHPAPLFAWRSKFHDFLYKVDPQSPTRTIKAKPGKYTGPFHWKNRHFTLEELKRLQGFPDDFTLVGSYNKVLEQIGNSVPPELGRVVAASVREQLLRPSASLTYPVRPEGFVSSSKQRQRLRSESFREVARTRLDSHREVGMAPVPDTSYFVRQKGLFERKIISRNDTEKIEGEGSLFSVDIITDRRSVGVSIASLASPKASRRRWTINIQGLAKYMPAIDTVVCEAWVSADWELFAVWQVLEDVLVARSRFFSLIDIYGHYANRGDVVEIVVRAHSRRSALHQAIQYFSSSGRCGAMIPLDKVAADLRLAPTEVLELVRDLRDLRFDVRTSLTHPTIRGADLLCTYPFPLLSPRAQLERGTSVRSVAAVG
jgi:DNA (cytosine-5)-methyltransferase 1